MVVGLDKSSNLPLFDLGKDIKGYEEQVGDKLVGI